MVTVNLQIILIEALVWEAIESSETLSNPSNTVTTERAKPTDLCLAWYIKYTNH